MATRGHRFLGADACVKRFSFLAFQQGRGYCRIYLANSDIFAGFIQMIVTLFNPANSNLFAGLLGSWRKGRKKVLYLQSGKQTLHAAFFLPNNPFPGSKISNFRAWDPLIFHDLVYPANSKTTDGWWGSKTSRVGVTDIVQKCPSNPGFEYGHYLHRR